MNKISTAGDQLTVLFEGKAYYPYLCPAGIVTTAKGHRVRPGEEKTLLGGFSIEETEKQLRANRDGHLKKLKPLTEQQIDALYKSDTAGAKKALDDRLKAWKVPPLTDDEYTLFHDLAYNGGPGFLDGSIKGFLEKGKILDAVLFAPKFCGITNSAKQLIPLPGLTFRRYSFVWLALTGEAWRIGSEATTDQDWAEVSLFLAKLTAVLKKKGVSNPLPYYRNTRAAQNRPLPRNRS